LKTSNRAIIPHTATVCHLVDHLRAQAPELKIVCAPFEVLSSTDENKVCYELARLVTLYRI